MAEVLFEYIKQGNSVRVAAIDVATKVEAIVVVPANLSEKQMQQIALQKLKYILQDEKQ